MSGNIRVINVHKDFGTPILTHRIYIGRPTPLGNPYKLMKESDRQDVLVKFEDWLRFKMRSPNPTSRRMQDLLAVLRDGRNLDLECSCAPKSCHGDIIKKLLNEMLEENHAV